jgi:hypothetical protein
VAAGDDAEAAGDDAEATGAGKAFVGDVMEALKANTMTDRVKGIAEAITAKEYSKLTLDCLVKVNDIIQNAAIIHCQSAAAASTVTDVRLWMNEENMLDTFMLDIQRACGIDREIDVRVHNVFYNVMLLSMMYKSTDLQDCDMVRRMIYFANDIPEVYRYMTEKRNDVIALCNDVGHNLDYTSYSPGYQKYRDHYNYYIFI